MPRGSKSFYCNCSVIRKAEYPEEFKEVDQDLFVKEGWEFNSLGV